jgi:dTDP-4-dehydrorhamnose 3,5-epimerase-like enzyme
MSAPDRPSLDAIEGLRWSRHTSLSNGSDSQVVLFPLTRLFNVVFHGDGDFEYGHYGVHLGQEDRLTFLGEAGNTICAKFIDCRLSSLTSRKHLTINFEPSSEWELQIPPGVAHTFEGLGGIGTINCYKLFLPEPQDWITASSQWTADSDIINIPIDVELSSMSLYKVNSCPASKVFYAIMAEKQRESLAAIKHDHPYTTDYTLPDGSSVVLKIRERNELALTKDNIPVCHIDGIEWKNHPFVRTGDSSGIAPFLAERPFYVVDHGGAKYTHDAYGIHLGQEDRLTFIGDTRKEISAEFVDCRKGSKTLHDKFKITFKPSATRTLRIPHGIAHRFEHLENIFTINQGVLYTDGSKPYDAANDVVDWPAHADEFPILDVNKTIAEPHLYDDLVRGQSSLKQAELQSTPVVIIARDDSGRDVRVAIRTL